MIKVTLVIDPKIEFDLLKKFLAHCSRSLSGTAAFDSRMSRVLRASVVTVTAAALVALPLGVSVAGVPSEPAAVSISCEGTETNSIVTISFGSGARPRHTTTQGDVIVEFGGAYKSNSTLTDKACSRPLKAVRTGFSTLVLRFDERSELSVTSSPSSLQISALSPADEPRAALAEAKARVLFELGEKQDAIQILNDELSRDPANSLLLSSRGSYEARIGDAHRALRTLSDLEAKGVSDIDYGLLMELRDPYSSVIGGSFESIDGGSAFEEQIYTLFTQAPVSNETVPGVLYGSAEFNHSSLENLRSPTGEIVNKTRNQERYTLEYRHPLERDDLQFGVRGNEENFGAHFRLDLRAEEAGTFIRAQVNEPNWEYSSSIAFDGVKHAAGVGHQMRLSPQLRVGGEVSQNFFELDSVTDAAKSLSANANVGWLLATDPASFELVYALDADYFYDVTERSFASGESYKVFSIQSTEYHSLTLNAVKTLRPASRDRRPIELYGVGGVAYDRLGETAPLIGAGLRGGQARGLSGQVEIGRTFTTVGNSDTQTRVLASAVWRF